MDSVRRYFLFLRWIVSDSFLRYKLFSAVVLGAGALGVAFQLQAFAIAVFYARHFASGELLTIQWFGLDYTVDARTSTELLLVMGGGMLFSLLLSACAIYWSRWGEVRMMRRYNEYCTRRVFGLLASGAPFFLDPSDCDSGEQRYLLRLAGSDARLCGRVFRMLLGVSIPFFSLCIAFAGLVYIEPFLTMSVLLILAFGLLIQVRINFRAADYSLQYERYAPKTSKHFALLINKYRDLPIGQAADMRKVDALVEHGPFKKELDAYEGRIRSVDESRFASGLVMALVLALVVWVMGRGIILEGGGWGRLLVYLVAARVAMTGLQGVLGRLTGVNRFYPQVSRYARFVQGFNGNVSDDDFSPSSYPLAVPAANSGETVELKPGCRVGCICEELPSRYSVGNILGGMLNLWGEQLTSEIRSMQFVTRKASCPDRPVVDCINQPEASTWDAIGLPAQLAERLDNALPNGPAKIISPGSWSRLDANLRFTLALLCGVRSGCRWLFVEERGLRSLQADGVALLNGSMGNPIVIITHRGRLRTVGEYGEDVIALVEGGRLTGVGGMEWFAAIREQIENRLRSRRDESAQDEDVEDDI
ncbi:hypothetical protein SAMN02745704_00159 [Paucidesulfovibrio gracilis DSM 16080]|uniref:Uncharacterized protein n=1 Tax=Paucidesulfovibrio gracilis DSM 16080 TaxID=1121449 RepID=A0A1T4W2Q0_9BACT|nr:hypothetical protein [Paucidesulfovibrio gracilis]SKA71540.1 hypothetical protein SAMN02745704_00159 [Paucidesulfovibrio gracilis DSM 16080]